MTSSSTPQNNLDQLIKSAAIANRWRTQAVAAGTATAAPAIASLAASAQLLRLDNNKPNFSDLPAHVIHQLRSDGTRDGMRSLEEAQAIYNNLPNNLNTIEEIEKVVASHDYELGHIIPHAWGGASDAGNTQYMPSDLNREIGASIPTEAQLNEAASAVASEGFIGGSEAIEFIAETGAMGATPIAARAIGSATKLVGGFVRQDQNAVSQSLQELPGELATGAQEGLTRGIPAAIGGALGPAGFVSGLVAVDFVEAIQSDDPSVKVQKTLEGSVKAGAAAFLICNPYLSVPLAIGYLGMKFFNF